MVLDPTFKLIALLGSPLVIKLPFTVTIASELDTVGVTTRLEIA